MGVVGPNGAGKTTLFRMIAGQEEPDRGELHLGESVVLGYVDQSRDSLDNSLTVFEEITGGVDTLAMGGRETDERSTDLALLTLIWPLGDDIAIPRRTQREILDRVERELVPKRGIEVRRST